MKVLEFLSDESRWVKGYNAVDINGNSVNTHSPDAVKWCVIGAVGRCYGDAESDELAFDDALKRLYVALSEIFGHRLITQWQDDPSTTFAMIQELVTKAGV